MNGTGNRMTFAPRRHVHTNAPVDPTETIALLASVKLSPGTNVTNCETPAKLVARNIGPKTPNLSPTLLMDIAKGDTPASPPPPPQE
ncbi:unnamed protein product [Phytophthora lilii]|uniref:Unnamed protein product n=1 Tax=Phytophthora lilii TaxID=2077276 RepID=A0A9W7CKP1_9STRA|nr:unnamed protein product [Phytophthora lilii]